MRRLRFRLGSLLVLIIVLGVGFAALRESNDAWDGGVFTLTLGVFLISTLLAIHRTESRRAFWLGFALFGWAYLGLSLVPPVESRWITTKLLAYIDSRITDRPIVISGRVWDTWSRRLGRSNQSINSTSIAFSPQGNPVASGNQGVIRVWDVSGSNPLGTWSGTAENFVRIGHALFALIAAFVGGWLSGYLYAKNRRPAHQETEAMCTDHVTPSPGNSSCHPSSRRPPRWGVSRKVRSTVIGLLFLAGATLCPREVTAGVTYTLDNYSTLQNGYAISGTITTNGAFGTALPTTDVISWDIRIMNGATTIATLTDSTGSIFGNLDLSPSSITVGTNGDDILVHDDISNAAINWENINGTLYGAGQGHTIFWSTGAWDATSPVASRLTLAIPEPSSALLAAFGVVGILAYARSRRRRDQRRQATG